MQDIAMHILELIMNSIKAKAKKIVIRLIYDDNSLMLEVSDDGCGMSQENLNNITNPFYTTRTTRKVGLGVSFFKMLADMCEGSFEAKSQINIGTSFKVIVNRNHLDLPPLGNIGEMMMLGIQNNGTIDYQLIYQKDDKDFIFDTKEIKELLGVEELSDLNVLMWIKDYINQEIK